MCNALFTATKDTYERAQLLLDAGDRDTAQACRGAQQRAAIANAAGDDFEFYAWAAAEKLIIKTGGDLSAVHIEDE